MHPILYVVFGRQIASYGVCIVLGAVAAWFLVACLERLGGKPWGKGFDNVWMSFLICICGAIVGAVLLRPITRIPELLINWRSFLQMPAGAVMGYLFGEVVFYGGLIGGAAALFIFCGRFGIPALPMADLFAPAVALAHMFGRVGCFLGGCCYGVEVGAGHPFAVRFPPETAGGARPGVPLLATQLIEALCLLVIAAVLALAYRFQNRGLQGRGRLSALSRKSKTENRFLSWNPWAAPDGFVLCLYGILYSVMRFALEFYRGDPIRGVYGPFSTSQYISIAVFLASAGFLAIKWHKSRQRAAK